MTRQTPLFEYEQDTPKEVIDRIQRRARAAIEEEEADG
jgi:hypothetical protein